jgi:hypothetical protein
MLDSVFGSATLIRGNMRTTMGYTYMLGGSTVSPYVCGVQPIAMAHALYTINLEAVPSQTLVRVYVVAGAYTRSC